MSISGDFAARAGTRHTTPEAEFSKKLKFKTEEIKDSRFKIKDSIPLLHVERYVLLIVRNIRGFSGEA